MNSDPELKRRTKTMGRRMDNGYVYIYKPSHPKAKSHGGYVGEHVLVMECSIGRYLENDEIVHHKDENRSNNSIKNLEIKSKSDHARDHSLARGPEKVIELVCSGCHKKFSRKLRQVKTKIDRGQRDFYCSRSCMAGQFGRGRPKLARLSGK